MAKILSVDQGTTSSRAVIFSETGVLLAEAQRAFDQHFPQDGWVEHDPAVIWQTVKDCCMQVLQQHSDVSAMGISNQRETTIIWHRETGQPIYNAIVWQDRRTASHCRLLRQQGKSQLIGDKTGLLLDPYFSATKIAWILKHVDGARQLAEQGKLCFGTVDSYLIWQLTQGQRHVTDITNAARTMLFNIETCQWDTELCELFDVPMSLLPEVLDNCEHFGTTHKDVLGAEIPICGVAGDQQAASIGQACVAPGMIKSTYGTGCFVMVNTGQEIIPSKVSLLSTIAYRINNEIAYALEGSIFNAGTIVQWLRDKAHFIADSKESEAIASAQASNNNVYFVPAFTGLGAPYWDAHARGAILGLTRDSSDKDIVRAGLEAVCYQTKDLLNAIQEDGVSIQQHLRVDGGMVANNWLLQFLSDILQMPVERPTGLETSAHGAAYLAAVGAGHYKNLQEISQHWQSDQLFKPTMASEQAAHYYKGWQAAVRKTLTD